MTHWTNEDNQICEINLNAINLRPCKAKRAHLGIIDASLVGKTLTVIGAPHLETETLITKLDDVIKTVNVDYASILGEHIKDPAVGTVRS